MSNQEPIQIEHELICSFVRLYNDHSSHISLLVGSFFKKHTLVLFVTFSTEMANEYLKLMEIELEAD